MSAAGDDPVKRGLANGMTAFLQTVLADALPDQERHGDDVVAVNQQTGVYHEPSLVPTSHRHVEIVAKATATERGCDPCTHCYATPATETTGKSDIYRGP